MVKKSFEMTVSTQIHHVLDEIKTIVGLDAVRPKKGTPAFNRLLAAIEPVLARRSDEVRQGVIKELEKDYPHRARPLGDIYSYARDKVARRRDFAQGQEGFSDDEGLEP